MLFLNRNDAKNNMLSIESIEKMLKEEDPAELIALYTLYCNQSLYTVKTSDWLAAKSLNWGFGKVDRVKRRLIDIGLIEVTQEKHRNHESKLQGYAEK